MSKEYRQLYYPEILLETVRLAYKRGLRSKDIRPEAQLAQWLIMGIKALEAGEELVSDKMETFCRMGGTDHPDPTLRSMG